MIYWVMSIKERELIIGVLRASGFHKKEVVQMLLIEQLFAGVLSVLAGVAIGWISSSLFVPIIQLSFASSTQILPLRLIIERMDLFRLYGVMAEKLPIPYFWCRIITDSACVLFALLFHGLIGIGTLICAVGLGPFISFFTKHAAKKICGIKE